jgi:hypothetical protein
MKISKPRLKPSAQSKHLKHFRAFGLLNWGLRSRELVCEAEAYLAGLGMQGRPHANSIMLVERGCLMILNNISDSINAQI